MTNIHQYANNAQSTLATSINNTVTTLAVAAGQGALFPVLGAGQSFFMTITDVATQTDIEIMEVTARSTDTFTVIRGQEGTAAQNWTAGDIINQRITASDLAAFQQQAQAQAQSQNYAADSGSVNALACTLSPSISAPVPGMPIRLLIAHTNTGPATLNPGSGVSPITNIHGAALVGGELVIGCIGTFIWDTVTSSYQWMGTSPGTNRTGEVVDFAGSAAPAGSVLCFGQAISRTTFALLFAIIGTTYGVGDGSTTFNVPDLRGRVIAGRDNMGGTPAGLLTSTTMSPDGNTDGAVGGSQQNTAVTTVNVTGNATGNIGVTGSMLTLASVSGSVNAGSGSSSPLAQTGDPVTGTITGVTLGYSFTVTPTSGAFSIVQPTMIMNKIIYY